MKKAIISTIVMSFLLVACTGEKKQEESKEQNEVTELQILFNGSSTLAPVISTIATDFNEEHGTWDQVDKKFPKEPITIYVSSGGSGQGVKSLLDGTTTYGMLAREVKEEEKKQIKDCKETLVGIDALTLSVNPENPITKVKDNLTKEEIIQIFSGKYTTWKDVDSSLPDEKIIVVTRDIGGGAHEVFQNKIMGDEKVTKDAIQAASMGALVQKIIDNPYAIGYASFGVAKQNEGKLVMLKVDGVEATKENIQNGSYVIQRPLLLLSSGKESQLQQAFLKEVLGENGQNTVEKMGFIPNSK